jgi:DNA replication and repair protein RecF
VHIGAIEFTDFRNFQTLSFTPTPSLNILAGPNAQGKSNLLEGLGVLLIGRSFRGAKAAEMARWGSPHATVLEGELLRGEARSGLRRVIQPREGTVAVVSGQPCPWARVIPFGWQDMGIVHGSPQARRDFLDGFAGKLYPAHLAAWSRYRQVLARRNHLLQSGLSLGELRGRLDPWNEQIVRVGIELLERRRAAVAAIDREVARVYPELAGQGAVRLVYRCSLGEPITEAGFREALGARLTAEAARGITLVGPHRDDLGIELDGRDLRSYGSRGQQRLLALALRLAERGPVASAVGSEPVLLLDDALSELDPRARERVLRHVARAGQVFLTTAENDLGDSGPTAWWEVSGGRLHALEMAAVRGAA